MAHTSRAFAGDVDVPRLVEVVTALAPLPHSTWHVGDVLWGLYQNTVFEPHKHIQLWERHGNTLGFVWFYPPSAFSWQLRADAEERDAIAREMLDWAEQHRRDLAQGDEAALTLVTTALDGDAEQSALLERHGYQREENLIVHMRRTLDDEIPGSTLPPSVVVRPLNGAGEYAERVAIHREVWDPSKVTIESYARLRTVPGYTPDLDLAAVMADGTFASYCICWLDQVNGIGEFEPVGTRAAFRRQGLGQAVMYEGLRRLKAHGMTVAHVLTYGSNDAAIGLYESVGFQIRKREYDYSKRLLL